MLNLKKSKELNNLREWNTHFDVEDIKLEKRTVVMLDGMKEVINQTSLA